MFHITKFSFLREGFDSSVIMPFPGVLWLWHFLYSVGPSPVSSLHMCRGHSWRVRLAKQETLTPPGHLVSPLVCKGPWTCILHLSDRIYPIDCTYLRIKGILWPRQILRAVKVRAIWSGKEPCSFYFLPRCSHVDRDDGQVHTCLYDKCNDFNFHITNFPLLSSKTSSTWRFFSRACTICLVALFVWMF